MTLSLSFDVGVNGCSLTVKFEFPNTCTVLLFININCCRVINVFFNHFLSSLVYVCPFLIVAEVVDNIGYSIWLRRVRIKFRTVFVLLPFVCARINWCWCGRRCRTCATISTIFQRIRLLWHTEHQIFFGDFLSGMLLVIIELPQHRIYVYLCMGWVDMSIRQVIDIFLNAFVCRQITPSRRILRSHRRTVSIYILFICH